MNHASLSTAVLACTLALCAGCSGTFTSKAPVSHAYVLRSATVTGGDHGAATPPAFDGTLRIRRPIPAPGFETDRILLLRDGRELDFYATGHWAAPIPDMIEALTVESLRRAAYFSAVYGENSPMRSEYFLQVIVRDFVAEYPGDDTVPVARVALECTLGRRLDRAVMATFTAEGQAPAAANRMNEVVAAYEAALQQALASAAASLAAAAKQPPPPG